MKTETLNSAELRTAGYKALAAALGPLGMARFLRQFEQGNGDYTPADAVNGCATSPFNPLPPASAPGKRHAPDPPGAVTDADLKL